MTKKQASDAKAPKMKMKASSKKAPADEPDKKTKLFFKGCKIVKIWSPLRLAEQYRMDKIKV
jgi:hypothetical protein